MPTEAADKSVKNRPGGRKDNSLYQKRQLHILKKATQLFIKKGYAQTSMREISKATGIDIRNLYYFIKSKEQILFLVFEMLHNPVYGNFKKDEILNIDDPVLQLSTAIREMINSGYDYGDEILLMYRESKSLPKRLLKVILQSEYQVFERIEEILKRGVERNVFFIEDTSFTANMILYQLSIYPLRHWNMKKYSKQELMDLIEKNVMKTVMP
jgi:AcrR family transcriptional regulator